MAYLLLSSPSFFRNLVADRCHGRPVLPVLSLAVSQLATVPGVSRNKARRGGCDWASPTRPPRRISHPRAGAAVRAGWCADGAARTISFLPTARCRKSRASMMAVRTGTTSSHAPDICFDRSLSSSEGFLQVLASNSIENSSVC